MQTQTRILKTTLPHPILIPLIPSIPVRFWLALHELSIQINNLQLFVHKTESDFHNYFAVPEIPSEL